MTRATAFGREPFPRFSGGCWSAWARLLSALAWQSVSQSVRTSRLASVRLGQRLLPRRQSAWASAGCQRASAAGCVRPRRRSHRALADAARAHRPKSRAAPRRRMPSRRTPRAAVQARIDGLACGDLLQSHRRPELAACWAAGRRNYITSKVLAESSGACREKACRGRRRWCPCWRHRSFATASDRRRTAAR